MPSAPKSKRSTRSTSGGRLLKPMSGLKRPVILGILVLASTVGIYLYQSTHASGGTASLESGVNAGGNWCLNDTGGDVTSQNPVNTAKCDGSDAQQWVFSGGVIKNTSLSGTHCIQPKEGAFIAGTIVVMDSCNGHAAQTWSRYNGGFQNPYASTQNTNKGLLCLGVPNGNTAVPVRLEVCSAQPDQNWVAANIDPGPTVGQQIRNIAADFAGREHESPGGCNCGGATIDGANIDNFTGDFKPYNVSSSNKAWCAYFVSWVYYKSGHSFGGPGKPLERIGLAYDLPTWFQNNGYWWPRTSANAANHPPQAGDVVVYTDGSGHTGIVDKISGSSLTSIDGNWSDGVNWESRANWKTDGSIKGWGRLKSAN